MAKSYLEANEVESLERAATNLRDKLLIRTLFHLGCRISEALTLKVEDIDFTQSTVAILHLKRRLKLSCANCGATLGISHSFCPRCGVKVNEAIYGITNCGTRRIDRHIFYSRGEAKWLSC